MDSILYYGENGHCYSVTERKWWHAPGACTECPTGRCCGPMILPQPEPHMMPPSNAGPADG